jgi:hypothetical protein
LQLVELLLQGLRAAAIGRLLGGRRGQLLAEQGLRERFLLLGLVQPLGDGLELLRQAREQREVGVRIFRLLAQVLALEGGQPRVLLVQLGLGLRQLLRQELGRVFGLFLTQARIRIHEHGGDPGADLLRQPGVSIGHVDVEAGQRLGGRPGHDADRAHLDRLAQPLHQNFHGDPAGITRIQMQLLDQVLQARAAEDLALHAGQALVQVVAHHRLHIAVGHHRFLHQHSGVRGVLFGKDRGHGDAQHRAQHRRQDQAPAPPPQDPQPVGCRQFSWNAHGDLTLNAACDSEMDPSGMFLNALPAAYGRRPLLPIGYNRESGREATAKTYEVVP